MQSNLSELIDRSTTIFWFRRDLRLEDNAGLYHALKENKSVLPVFIFDTEILDDVEDKSDARVTFIHDTILQLKEDLENVGSSLLILHGNPTEIFKQLKPLNVYANHDYEPYATNRDETVKRTLANHGIAFNSFKDQVIFEKDEVVKESNQPYTVFTPYSRKWKATLNKFYVKSYPTAKYLRSLKQTQPLKIISLKEIGFTRSSITPPARILKGKLISKYHQTRDIPGINGTSRLGIHLRFGTLSIRKAVRFGLSKNETWLNELIWREFYQMILSHFPHVVEKCFKREYDRIKWKNDPVDFARWCAGTTGYPLVDAGMRELNETGLMHNRVRMVTASFLTKHLLIDWRWGEAYFAKKLLDYDLASNNGGWQWAAGCGCDAAPYFRVFNPTLQMQKFDPDLAYINKWVPEYGTGDYPHPIVNHQDARERVLQTYQKALNKS